MPRKKDVLVEDAFLDSLSPLAKELYDNDDWGDGPPDPAKVIPSGVFEIDNLLFRGHGGFVLGRRYELWGRKGSGKSSLIYRIMGNAHLQFPDKLTAILDTEEAHPKDLLGPWAQSLGADVNKVKVYRPENLDHTYRLLEDLAQSGKYSVIAWDSYGATVPVPTDSTQRTKWNKREFGPGKYGTAEAARTNPAGLGILRPLLRKNNVLFLCVNQARTNLSGFRARTDSAGGHALHHFFDVRLEMQAIKDIVEHAEVVGHEIYATVGDSRLFRKGAKTGPKGLCPHIKFFYDGRTIGYLESVVDTAVKQGVVTNGGGVYKWRDISVKGKPSFMEAVERLIGDLWDETQLALMALPIEPGIDDTYNTETVEDEDE